MVRQQSSVAGRQLSEKILAAVIGWLLAIGYLIARMEF
jgi:hypothetical protein